MESLKEKHRSFYGIAPKVETFTPGVVTLFGTHTDYTGGSSLSVTLEKGVAGTASPRTDRLIKLLFDDIDDQVFTLDLEELETDTQKMHQSMLVGLIKKLVHEGYDVSRGIDMTLKSTIKKESDTGFDAAIMMTLLNLLLNLNEVSLKDEKKVRYINHVQKNHLKQFVSRSEPWNMLKGESCMLFYSNPSKEELSCVSFDFENHALLLLDTNRAPDLSINTIMKRINQVDKGYVEINANRSIEHLGSLSIEKFNQFKTFIKSPITTKRVEHVIFENDRTMQAVEALKQNEYLLLGELITQSHTSLKELMEVSCDELDYIVNDLIRMNALGAKMTGLGFGGSAIALFEKSDLPSAKMLDDLRKRYNKRFHKTLTIKQIDKDQ